MLLFKADPVAIASFPPPLLVFFLQRARLCTVRQKEEVRSAWMRVQASQQRRKVQDLRQSFCRCATASSQLPRNHRCQKVPRECCMRLGKESQRTVEDVHCQDTANGSTNASTSTNASNCNCTCTKLAEACWMLQTGPPSHCPKDVYS